MKYCWGDDWMQMSLFKNLVAGPRSQRNGLQLAERTDQLLAKGARHKMFGLCIGFSVDLQLYELMQRVPGSLKAGAVSTPLHTVVRNTFSHTVRRSAALPGCHHRCYFRVRPEAWKCSTLGRFMSAGTALCCGAQRGQAQPGAGAEHFPKC